MADEWEHSRAADLLTVAKLLSYVEEYDCALELLEKVLKLKPEMIEARIELGIVYGRIENNREMVEAFREAIRLSPRGVRTVILKYPEETERLYRIFDRQESSTEPQVTTRLPELPADLKEAEALIALASHHLKRGWDEAAVAALERSLRLDPASAQALLMLSMAYLLLEFRGRVIAGSKESVLWEIDSRLAIQLFKR
jgi:tetratricopeptide (TPR) repeat protein